MRPGERTSMIEELVAAAPDGLGLREAARQNFEALDDVTITEMRQKVVRIRDHSAQLMRPNGDLRKALSDLAKKRQQAYAKLSEASKPRRGKENLAPLPLYVQGATSPHIQELVAYIRGPLVQDIPLSLSADVWNVYERNRSVKLVDRLRRIVLSWVADFDTKIFGRSARDKRLAPLLSASFQVDFTNYLEFALDRIGRDTMRLLRSHIEMNDLAADLGAPSPELLNWLLIDKALSDTAFDTAFIANARGVLHETRAIDGLAKLRIFAHDYKADAIVSLAGGGQIVGDFIARESGIDPKRCWLLEQAGSGVRFIGSDAGPWSGFERILLVDDIVFNGNTLFRAHNKLAKLSRHANIHIVALMGSLEGRDSLVERSQRTVFVPNVATEGEMILPWNRDGQYQRTRMSHVFGHGTSMELKIGRAQIRRVSIDLATEAPEQGRSMRASTESAPSDRQMATPE